MTLYEPAFAVVARRYGANSRGGITALTLWGGFASTVFVPLTQLLLDHLGWRDTLMALGAINLALCVALHLAVIDPKADAPEQVAASGDENRRALVGRQVVRWALAKPAFWALLVSFTVYYGTFSGVRPCGWTRWTVWIDHHAGLSQDGSHGQASFPQCGV